MKFGFDIGQRERHRVECFFNRYSDRARIAVDGAPLRQRFRPASADQTRRYEVEIGLGEQYAIVIEHERPPLLRPQEYRVFVDGELIGTHTGFLRPREQRTTV